MESTPFTAYRKEHANAANDKPQTLAELDLLDDLREQRAKVRACTRPWRLPR